jgi:hypothetical protein
MDPIFVQVRYLRNPLSGGKIVENWNNWEALEMMRQIGVIPDAEHTQGV